jgi:hypothetical protein
MLTSSILLTLVPNKNNAMPEAVVSEARLLVELSVNAIPAMKATINEWAIQKTARTVAVSRASLDE